MNLLNQSKQLHKQLFQWGEIEWLHEPTHGARGGLSVARVIIYPGCHQDKHTHLSEEQLFVVESGEGIFMIDGNREKILKGAMLYIKPFSEHEVINTSEDLLIFTVIYAPIRVDVVYREPIMLGEERLLSMISSEILEELLASMHSLTGLRVFVADEQMEAVPYSYEGTSMSTRHLYICENQALRLQIPLSLNDKVLGYLITEPFIFDSDTSSKSPPSHKTNMNRVIKSRIHMVNEQLIGAVDYILSIAISQWRDKQLLDKDLVLASEKQEKLQLKEALKRANMRLPLFGVINEDLQEAYYPYALDERLRHALRSEQLSVDSWLEIWESALMESSLTNRVIRELLMSILKDAFSPYATFDELSELRRDYLALLSTETLMDVAKSLIIHYLDMRQSKQRCSVVEAVNAYIETHYKESITLKSLSEHFYVSPNYLSTQFNLYNGISLTDFVQKIRVENAKLHLRDPHMKVSEITKKVGYSSESYFIKAFKKHVGMTPLNYRHKIFSHRV